jgi:hypothetical protein
MMKSYTFYAPPHLQSTPTLPDEPVPTPDRPAPETPDVPIPQPAEPHREPFEPLRPTPPYDPTQPDPAVPSPINLDAFYDRLERHLSRSRFVRLRVTTDACQQAEL